MMKKNKPVKSNTARQAISKKKKKDKGLKQFNIWLDADTINKIDELASVYDGRTGVVTEAINVFFEEDKQVNSEDEPSASNGTKHGEWS